MATYNVGIKINQSFSYIEAGIFGAVDWFTTPTNGYAYVYRLQYVISNNIGTNTSRSITSSINGISSVTSGGFPYYLLPELNLTAISSTSHSISYDSFKSTSVGSSTASANSYSPLMVAGGLFRSQASSTASATGGYKLLYAIMFANTI